MQFRIARVVRLVLLRVGLGLLQLGLRRPECVLEGALIEGEEQGAGRDLVAFREMHLGDHAIDLALDRDGVQGLHQADGVAGERDGPLRHLRGVDRHGGGGDRRAAFATGVSKQATNTRQERNNKDMGNFMTAPGR